MRSRSTRPRHTSRPTGEVTFDFLRESVIDGEARSVGQVGRCASRPYVSAGRRRRLSPRVAFRHTARSQVTGCTRPGFLSAVADLMHRQTLQWRNTHAVSTGEPLGFGVSRRTLPVARDAIGRCTQPSRGRQNDEQAIASQLQIKNRATGVDRVLDDDAVDGPLAEMPLTATYRPRWWIEVHLTLNDSTAGPAPVSSGRTSIMNHGVVMATERAAFATGS